MNVWTLMIQRNLMIPRYFMIQRGISIGSMDFDNPKVYGDTSIFDSLVLYGHHEAPQIKVLVVQARPWPLCCEDLLLWGRFDLMKQLLIVPFELEEKTPVQCNGSINVMLDPLPPLLCIFSLRIGSWQCIHLLAPQML